eukprot:Rmarinus@m.5121
MVQHDDSTEDAIRRITLDSKVKNALRELSVLQKAPEHAELFEPSLLQAPPRTAPTGLSSHSQSPIQLDSQSPRQPHSSQARAIATSSGSRGLTSSAIGSNDRLKESAAASDAALRMMHKRVTSLEGVLRTIKDRAKTAGLHSLLEGSGVELLETTHRPQTTPPHVSGSALSIVPGPPASRPPLPAHGRRGSFHSHVETTPAETFGSSLPRLKADGLSPPARESWIPGLSSAGEGSTAVPLVGGLSLPTSTSSSHYRSSSAPAPHHPHGGPYSAFGTPPPIPPSGPSAVVSLLSESEGGFGGNVDRSGEGRAGRIKGSGVMQHTTQAAFTAYGGYDVESSPSFISPNTPLRRTAPLSSSRTRRRESTSGGGLKSGRRVHTSGGGQSHLNGKGGAGVLHSMAILEERDRIMSLLRVQVTLLEHQLQIADPASLSAVKRAISFMEKHDLPAAMSPRKHSPAGSTMHAESELNPHVRIDNLNEKDLQGASGTLLRRLQWLERENANLGLRYAAVKESYEDLLRKKIGNSVVTPYSPRKNRRGPSDGFGGMISDRGTSGTSTGLEVVDLLQKLQSQLEVEKAERLAERAEMTRRLVELESRNCTIFVENKKLKADLERTQSTVVN